MHCYVFIVLNSRFKNSNGGNNLRFYVGTEVFTPNGQASYIFLTNSTIKTKLGLPSSASLNNGNTVVFAMNGDYDAKNVYLLTCYQNGNWHVSDRAKTNLGTSPIRINYLIVYWG